MISEKSILKSDTKTMDSDTTPIGWTVPNHVLNMLDELMQARDSIYEEEDDGARIKKVTIVESANSTELRLTIPKTVTFIDVPEKSGRKLDSYSKNRKLRLIDAIPSLPRRLAVVCFILNCILPGLGTFISAVAVPCCSQDPLFRERWREVTFLNVSAALLQLFTIVYFFIGWFWSVVWGVILYYRSVYFTPRDVKSTRECLLARIFNIGIVTGLFATSSLS